MDEYTALEEGNINSNYNDYLPNSSNFKTANSLRFFYGYDNKQTYDSTYFQ